MAIRIDSAGGTTPGYSTDAAVKECATAVLNDMGLTVSNAVRILLTRVAKEGTLPFDFASSSKAHDAWFRVKVFEALNDPRPPVTHGDVEAYFAKRRAVALHKSKKGDA